MESLLYEAAQHIQEFDTTFTCGRQIRVESGREERKKRKTGKLGGFEWERDFKFLGRTAVTRCYGLAIPYVTYRL